jgi:hypothetical protein
MPQRCLNLEDRPAEKSQGVGRGPGLTWWAGTGSNRRPCGFQASATHPDPSGTVRLSPIRPGQQESRRTGRPGRHGVVRLGTVRLGRTSAESCPAPPQDEPPPAGAEGFEPCPAHLHRPRSSQRTARDLRSLLPDRDRSCPPTTSGSWCRADPARTSVLREWQAADQTSRRRSLGTRDTACPDSPAQSASGAGAACSEPSGVCRGGWTWPAPSGRGHPLGPDNALPPGSCHPDNHADGREALQADPEKAGQRPVTSSGSEISGASRRPAMSARVGRVSCGDAEPGVTGVVRCDRVVCGPDVAPV